MTALRAPTHRPAHARGTFFDRWWAALVVAASVAYFVLMASLWPNRPGIYMDETNFVPTALGNYPNQGFDFRRIHGFPFLIMSYIGALKTLLFAPIFALAGVSVTTIRLPAILISAATLVLAYLMAREVLGRWSVVLVVLMATCPSFIFLTKVDWGPNVLALFLSMAMLLAFFRYLRTSKVEWLASCLGLVLLGIYNKQDFVWLVIGAAVGAVTVYHRTLWTSVRTHLRPALASFAAFLVIGGIFGAAFVTSNLSYGGSASLREPLSHVGATWSDYVTTMGYAQLVGFFTGHVTTQPGWMGWLWIPVVAALVLLGLRRLQGPLPEAAAVPARAAVFFSIVFVVMLLQIAATKEASGPHHVIELLPYPILAGLCSLQAVWRAGSTLRIPLTLVAAVGLLGTLAVQGVSTGQFVSLMQNPARFKPTFSTDVYRDVAFLNSNASAVNVITTGGWGPGTPIFSLACPADRSKYTDTLWIPLHTITPENAATLVHSAFGNQRVLMVSVNDPSRAGIGPSLRDNQALIEQGYAQAYPGRHAQRVLTSQAYDITYYGPGTFEPRQGGCA